MEQRKLSTITPTRLMLIIGVFEILSEVLKNGCLIVRYAKKGT